MEDTKHEGMKVLTDRLQKRAVDKQKYLLSNSPIAEAVKAAGYSVVDCPGKDVTRLPLLVWNDAGERYVIVRARDFCL